jgi:hypothetical protein
MPALFRRSRLKLRECLVSGDLPVDTLVDMIRDGRCWDEELDRNGPRLYFGDHRLNNTWFEHYIERVWGWGWLRENPDIDIDASTILAPDLTPEPPLSMTETTFRQRLPSPPAPPRRWARMGLEIGADSFYRLLPSAEAAAVAAPPEAEPAAAAPSRTASQAELEKQVKIVVAERKAVGKTPERGVVLEGVRERLPDKQISERQLRVALERLGLTLPAHRPRKPRKKVDAK